MRVERPGIYDMSAMDYHADPAPAPSLSSSIARELLASSALHAWFAHPRLNTAAQPEESEKFDRGTVAHAYLLQGETGVVLIDAPDFRTKAAKEARDRARLDGKVPLLKHRWDDILVMAEAARRQLAVHEDPPRPLAGGQAEQTLVWQEDGVWCRARLDWLHDGRRTIDDYKTTDGSANPDAFSRTLFNMGYDVQAAFYLRGLAALTGLDAQFRFVVQETFPPFALSVIGLGPDVMDLAEKKVRHAIAAWRYCLETQSWPGYPTRTCWAELPPWLETQWLEREARAAYQPPPASAAVDDGRPLADQLFGKER